MGEIRSIFDFQERFFSAARDVSKSLLKVDGDVDIVTKELESGMSYPVAITSDFSVLIGEIPALNLAQKNIQEIFKELRKDFKELIGSRNFDDFNRRFAELVRVDALRNLPEVVKGIVHMQVGLTLSFAAVARRSVEFNINIDNFKDSFNQYFFSNEGYKTASGDMIVRPRLPKTMGQDLKAIGNQINAERYIRDITRIIVETSGDGMYDTRTRYEKLKEKYGDNGSKEESSEKSKNKLLEWFDSFGDMAEASLLPVIEEILNGAMGVQLNPLIAAAVGTFCSVTARKATEHSYLTLLGIALP